MTRCPAITLTFGVKALRAEVDMCAEPVLRQLTEELSSCAPSEISPTNTGHALLGHLGNLR